MAAEKIEVTQREATDADIASFISGEGNEWKDGSRFSQEVDGYGSGVQAEQLRMATLAANEIPQPLTEERLYENSPEQRLNLPPEEQNYRSLYGRSENEKGQWRRAATDALAELQQLKSEIAALRAGQGASYASPNAYAPSQPQPSYAPAAEPDYASMLPETFFQGKNPGDVVDVSEVDQVFKQMIGPAVLKLWHQQQEITKQQNFLAKRAAGITPQVEQSLLTNYPWLNNVPDGQARIAAMQDIIQRPSQPVSPAAVAQAQQPIMNPMQAAARRAVYVESGKPTSPSPDGGATLQQRMAAEFAQAKTAAEKRAVLMRYGARQVNDFGPDVFSR